MSEEGGEDYEWPLDDGSQGGNDDGDVLIQNTYYEAEDNKKTRPREALDQFEQVVQLEEQSGDEVRFRFKALENIVVLSA